MFEFLLFLSKLQTLRFAQLLAITEFDMKFSDFFLYSGILDFIGHSTRYIVHCTVLLQFL